ncbi:hypothetical protein WJX84_008362 [Apatococcus fuscideae]|uniref:Uncharacterized protein n=1 Tax=Apatococcus fuscideae TaxID=2026836 RepID=A0AAW1TH72_9CHLO
MRSGLSNSSRGQSYQQVFNRTFVKGEGLPSQHEDLLFFVPQAVGPGTPAFVRRRGKDALSDIHHTSIDWRRTLDLNLLVHSEYTLTVAACAYDALHIHRLQDSSSSMPGLTQVKRSIAALPVYMAVCPDGGRGGWEQPQPSYPNIYFAVDDFQEVFSSLDPLQEGHLPAQSPSSTPPADLASSANNAAHIRDGSRAQRGALPPESPSGPRAKRPAECSQRSESPMRGGFRANASLAFAWRPPLLDPTAGVDSGDPQPTRVKMTGPGGDGFAEVAVTWLPRSDPLDPSHHPSMDGSEPVDGTHLRAPDAADQRQGAKQAPPSDALKPAEFTSLHQTPAADRYSSHGPLHIRQKAVDGWEKQDPGHVAGKHSSVSSSSSGWVPVEGGSTGSSSGAEDDLGSWRSRLWSHVASRLPPSMTGIDALPKSDAGPMQVRCALMSLCLPADLLQKKMSA